MLKKLQEHWGVNGWRFFWIMVTFAITGSFTAWVSKSITGWLDTEKFSAVWWLLKIGVLLIGYQLFILFFGFCFGQFSFFWKYEKKILSRIGIIKRENKIKQLAIFASGAGTNAGNIINYFSLSKIAKVGLIVYNNENAGVVNVADKMNIPGILVSRSDREGNEILSQLKKHRIDYLILAGYLWKLPVTLINRFPGKIINIHPSLLPKFGGKGMYGNFVHEAVISNKEKESGITIHYVDEHYDNGEIILQKKCVVDPGDTPGSLAEKIKAMEHSTYPEAIQAVIEKQNHR
ncbi:MAG: phosphoribosylglycinamide formyltransferase [Ferruginibacter sp.]